MTDNGWQEWKKYVLSKLDELSLDVIKQKKERETYNQEILRQLESIRMEIHTIKITTSLRGVLIGALSTIATVIVAVAGFFISK